LLLFLFHLAALLSLLLYVAALGLWGWGHRTKVEANRAKTLSYYELAVSRGEFLLVAHHTTWPVHSSGWTFETPTGSQDLLPAASNFFPDTHPPVAGFFVGYKADRYDSITMILLPMWFFVSVFAILPTAAGIRHARQRRRARRVQSGRCIACGYDLRATLERCPECGRDAAASCERPTPQAGKAG
jgi:hypothetical protein